MEESIRFYRDVMGLVLSSRREIPENRAEIAFMEDQESGHRIELTYWKEKKNYSEGDQLDHIAFEVDNIDEAIKQMKAKGVEIAREPYTLSGSASRIAFVLDPNGIWIELIQRR